MMLLSEIINSRIKYEDRFKSIDNYISNNDVDRGVVDVLNTDIIHLKYNARHGYLKKVIQNRGVNAYATIYNLQEYRNKHYNVNGSVDNRFTDLSEIVDGKYNYRWKDRLEDLDNKLENLYKNKGTLNDLDEMKYVLYCLENNKYLNSKNDKTVIGLKNKVENKINKYIRRNRKRKKNVFMMLF